MQEIEFRRNAKGGVQREKCKRRHAKGGVQGEMQEVECIPEKEPLDALKHARWPAATCGSKLPTAKFRTWPGGRGMHARKISFVGGVCDFLQMFCGKGARIHCF